jgi:hypothetical protein
MSKAVDVPGQTKDKRNRYWRAVKKEMYILVCTGDKKYASIRAELSKAGSKSQMAMVSLIAAAMASYVGVIAGILVPMCALVLLAVVKIGKNAFCAQKTLDMRI